MWLIQIWSYGDTINDKYLYIDGEYQYNCKSDVDLREDTLKNTIKRIKNELKVIKKYRYNMVQAKTWHEVLERRKN